MRTDPSCKTEIQYMSLIRLFPRFPWRLKSQKNDLLIFVECA
jgi:hypothetical protein